MFCRSSKIKLRSLIYKSRGHATLFMLVVFLTLSASRPVCTKLRPKAPGRSHQCQCVRPVAMGFEPRSRGATHTGASTKLITAHQALHCDDHARSQSRGKVALPKHRALKSCATLAPTTAQPAAQSPNDGRTCVSSYGRELGTFAKKGRVRRKHPL